MVFYFWLRKQIRRFSTPIPLRTAEKYDRIFTHLYFLSAWTFGGIILYKVATKRQAMREIDHSYDIKRSALNYGRMMQTPSMEIYRFSGGSIVHEGAYRAEDHELKDEVDEFYGSEQERSTQ